MKEVQSKKELEGTASSSESGGMSRRRFMSRGVLAVGAAGATVAATGGLGLLTGSLAGAQTTPPTCATTPGTIKHPRGTWGYTTLDPDHCAERAYQIWWSKFCCYAVVDGVIGELQDLLGSPYTNIDPMMYQFGAGGVNGWGTLCGSPLGAAITVNTIVGMNGSTDVGSQMSNDLLAYYASTAMPVYIPVTSQYAAKGGTAPGYTPPMAIPSSTADSPLCHVSVSKWLIAANAAATADPANYGIGTTIKAGNVERKERCARLAATMAKKTAELLNAWHAGTYTPGAWGSSGVNSINGAPSQKNCTDCHGV
ncbi:MAG: hypothetical protein ACYC6O_05480 [Thermoleophilia bacterium]